jgi:hypothetical protein
MKSDIKKDDCWPGQNTKQLSDMSCGQEVLRNEINAIISSQAELEETVTETINK